MGAMMPKFCGCFEHFPGEKQGRMNPRVWFFVLEETARPESLFPNRKFKFKKKGK